MPSFLPRLESLSLTLLGFVLFRDTSGLQHRANYVDDSNLDTSYEGLLALSERIGTAVP